MQVSKNIGVLLMLLFVHGTVIMGQSQVDSLKTILDEKKVSGSLYMKASVELCRTLVNSNEEYLLPEYARMGLAADTVTTDTLNTQYKFALFELLGNYYWHLKMLNESAEQFNKMRLMGELQSNNEIMANSYNGLGTVYYLMDDYDQAMNYYRKGLTLAGTDSLLIVRLINNIANTFLQQNQTDSVFIYYAKSVEYHKAHQNFRQLSIAYSNIALAYQTLSNPAGIRENITYALEAANKSENPYQISAIYELMGYLAFEKHPDLALKCYNRALELSTKAKSYDQMQNCWSRLAELSEIRGNYKETTEYLRKIKILDDSLDLAHKKARIAQMESEHLEALRLAEQQRKDRDQEIKDVRDVTRQKNLITILLIASGALLILFLMGFYTYLLRMKITRTKEKFFSMIAHDIRNPFSGILGLSGILMENAENQDDPIHRKQVRSLHQSLNHVYDLLDNLLQWSQSETGKIAFHPQVQELSPFVHEVICLHTASGKQKGITLVNQIQTGLTARFDSNMLQTILRNLLSNAIKFSRENSTIFISAEVHGKEVAIKVRDEGIGMDNAQVELIFHAKERTSTVGTRNETGTGLGLSLCKNFITRHGGTIHAESKPGVGTTIQFTLPD